MPRTLLAVDLGLRTGLALYGEADGLRWYRSQHFGSRAALRRGAFGLLRDEAGAGLQHVVVEGGGRLAEVWAREADRFGATFHTADAADWRTALLHPREQRSSQTAKEAADRLARHVIEASRAVRPTSLRHDAAEAILLGLWHAAALGWVADPRALVGR